MPIEQITKKTLETKIDPIAEKQQVFKKIAETFPEYRELINHTEANPIAFVFQHSVADGLELAKKLGLTPEEIRKATIENPRFGLNHYDVIQKVRSYNFIGLPHNVHSENVYNQAHSLKTFDWSYTGPLMPDNARSYFESVMEKSRNEIKEFPAEIINSIGNYYSEFLPYQADKLKKSFEESQFEKGGVKNKKETLSETLDRYLDKGEKILLDKYLESLAKEVDFSGGRAEVGVSLAKLGIPQTQEIGYLVARLNQYRNYPQGEALPTLVISDGNGAKMNFNMEAARKPVAKIKEKIIIQEITKSAEDLINDHYRDSNGRKFKIVFDEVLEKHIVTGESVSTLSKEQQQGVIFETQESLKQFETLFDKYNLRFDHTNFDKVFSDFKYNNDDFKKELDIIKDDPAEFRWLDLTDVIKVLDGAQNNEFKKVFEYHIISDRISNSSLIGVSEYLARAVEHENKSSLSDNQIGELFLKFQDSVKSTLKHPKEMERPLQQLDAFKNPSIENLIGYFEPKPAEESYRDEEKKRVIMRTVIGRSKWLFDSIKTSLKDKAKWLLESFSMPAKSDDQPGRLAERLIAACYPAEWQKRLDQLKAQSQSNKGFSHSTEDIHGMTRNQFESQMAGANVGAKKSNLESNESLKGFEATFDKSVNAMLVTNIVSYDASLNMWKRTHIPVDGDMVQNRKFEKVSARLKNPISDSVSTIPAPLGSKEFSTDKKNIEKDSLGIHTAIGDGSLSTWSYEIPVGHVAIENVSDQTYTRFLDRLIDEGGSNYIEKIPGLPAECQMFLDTIKNLSPRDRVQQIQNFITTHSFYDSYDNEMRNEMNNAGVTSRVGLMQERLAQLRDELGDEVPDKMLFAGVCADFAIVGEMMLKESGIASGIVEGYRISGTKINSDNAHGKNIVLWPDDTGKTIMAEVEMTPSAFTDAQRAAFAEQGLKPEPLQQAILEAEEREKEHEEELKEKSDEILKQVEAMIAQNGESGMGLNKIELRNTIIDYISTICTLEDLYVYKRILESYRFTPINAANMDDLVQKNQGMEFMQVEHKRWKDDYKVRDDGLERISNSGKNLIGEIDRLFIKSAMAGTKDQYITAFKNIPSYLHKELPDNHKTLWKLLETYVENK